MKTASLLAKFSQLDATAFDAWSICEMATSNGARALGLGASIGSLEAGKAADLIAMRTKTPRMTPLLTGPELNVRHNLVHAVQAADVDLTMVGGPIVVDSGVLQTADLDKLIDRVNELVPPLFARRRAWLADHRCEVNDSGVAAQPAHIAVDESPV